MMLTANKRHAYMGPSLHPSQLILKPAYYQQLHDCRMLKHLSTVSSSYQRNITMLNCSYIFMYSTTTSCSTPLGPPHIISHQSTSSIPDLFCHHTNFILIVDYSSVFYITNKESHTSIETSTGYFWSLSSYGAPQYGSHTTPTAQSSIYYCTHTSSIIIII